MEKSKQEKNELLEWGKTLSIALIIALAIRGFLFAPTAVSGESMMPTLEDGEKMVVNKIGYSIGKPERFDIVLFHAAEEKVYIKRVIGLPGDHLAYRNDQLFVNGKSVDEPYLDDQKAQLPPGGGTLTEDFTLEEKTGEQIIPEGYVFVLGDNRRNSIDSRIIGLVPIDELIGKTKHVYWPPDEIRQVE